MYSFFNCWNFQILNLRLPKLILINKYFGKNYSLLVVCMVFMVTCRLSCTHHNTTFGYLKCRIMSFCRTPKVSSEEGRFLGVLSIVSACLLYPGVCTPKHNNDQLWYLTLRSVSSLNNPQNNELNFCENMKLTCWKSS